MVLGASPILRLSSDLRQRLLGGRIALPLVPQFADHPLVILLKFLQPSIEVFRGRRSSARLWFMPSIRPQS
jgi:hypothetical protein